MASTAEAHQSERATIAIEGMSCSSCAARIEKRLNRIDGVSASVNYAAEQAAVSFDPAHASVDDLIGAVEAAGLCTRPRPARRTVRTTRPGAGCSSSASRQFSRCRSSCCHGSRIRLPPVAMGIARAGHPGGVLLRLAVSPRGRDERQAPGRHDGHTHLPRHSGCLDLVGRRAADRHAGGRLLRCGSADHHVGAVGELLRGAGQAQFRRCDPQAARARRQGGPRPARRARATRCHRTAPGG